MRTAGRGGYTAFPARLHRFRAHSYRNSACLPHYTTAAYCRRLMAW